MLTQNDIPASGEHHISVSLWNAASGGEPIWSDDFTTQVTRGVFNFALGSDKPLPQSLGDATWISVSIDGGPPDTRSRLTAVPYALSSSSLSRDYVSSISVNGERIAGRASDVNIVTGEGIGATVDPATSSVLLSVDKATLQKGAKSQSMDFTSEAWGTQGNSLKSPTTNFIGTNDANSLEVHLGDTVSNYFFKRAFRYDYIASKTPNLIENPKYNIVQSGYGNIIAGGGSDTEPDSVRGNMNGILGGSRNWILDAAYCAITGGDSNIIIQQVGNTSTPNFSTIAGGALNRIEEDHCFIGAGRENLVDEEYSAIAAGEKNSIGSAYSFVGSGYHNVTRELSLFDPEGSSFSFIGAGRENSLDPEFSFIGAGDRIFEWADHSGIGGGDSNTIFDTSKYSFIGVGLLDSVGSLEHASKYSLIGGGEANSIIVGDHSMIGGGLKNKIHAHLAGIFSGYLNQIYTDSSVIAGGVADTIQAQSVSSFIGGGAINVLDTASTYSSIVGGRQNYTRGPYNVVSGGEHNRIVNSDHSIIVGGQDNVVENPTWGSILGGWQNRVGPVAWASTVVGGDSNVTHYSLSYIGGGWYNQIGSTPLAYYGDVLSGGAFNFIDYSAYATIGGGQSDSIQSSTFSTVAGGQNNHITASERAFIGGGCEHTIQNSKWATIGGGCGNTITDTLSTIGGGNVNTINAENSVIAGGKQNVILADEDSKANYGSILGGLLDSISAVRSPWIADTVPFKMPHFASVGGGEGNGAHGLYSSVFGGRLNHAVGKYATIPGGAFLEALDYQTVVGRCNTNAPYSTQVQNANNNDSVVMYTRSNQPTPREFLLDQDAPSFIVGNGGFDALTGTMVRSNAFEVRDKGYIVVTGDNGGPTPVKYGGGYADNQEVAWADVPFDATTLTPGSMPHKVVLNASFGIDSISHRDVGVYVVQLNTQVNTPGVTAPQLLKNVSIVVTIQNNDTEFVGAPYTPSPTTPGHTVFDTVTSASRCGYATASQVGILASMPNAFIVRTYGGNGSAGCSRDDLPFFVRVTGRKQ